MAEGWQVTQIDSAGNDATDTVNHAVKVNIVAGAAGGGVAQLQVRSTSDTGWVNVGAAAGDLPVPVNIVAGAAGSTSVLIVSGSIISTSSANPAWVTQTATSIAAAQSGVWIISTASGTPAFVTQTATSIAAVQSGTWVVSTASGTPVWVTQTATAVAVVQSGAWVVSTASGTPAFVTQTATSIAAVQSGTWIHSTSSTIPAWVTQTATSIAAAQSGTWIVSTSSVSPVRIDPVGTTIQPVSATSTSAPLAVNVTTTGGIPVLEASTWVVSTSSANPVWTIQSKNSGRTFLSFVVDQAAGTTVKTLATMTIQKGTSTSSSTNYTVTAGKTLRIQNISLSCKQTNATLNNSLAYVVATTSGTVATTSFILDTLQASAPVASTNAIGWADSSLPDGIEIPAGWNMGVAHVEVATTASISISINGFEY